MANSYNITQLKNKDKIFMGISGQPCLAEYFLNVEDGAVPDVNVWNTELNGGTVLVDTSDAIGFCQVKAGATGANHGSMNTDGKKMWSPGKGPLAQIIVKSVFRIIDLTGEFGIGLCNDVASVFYHSSEHMMAIKGNNDVITASSGDGTEETTDLTAYFADNIWVETEMVYTPTSVNFKIDGTVRATHLIRRPGLILRALLCSINTNEINTVMDVQKMEVWTR